MEYMTGAKVTSQMTYTEAKPLNEEKVLEVKNLCNHKVKDISFSLYKGEVLGCLLYTSTGCGFTVAGSAMGAGLEDVHYEGHSVRHMMRKMERLDDIWDEDGWDEDDDDWDEDDDWEDDSRSRSSGSSSSTDDTEDYSFDNIYSMDIELSCDELILRETDDSKFTVHVEGSDINRVRVGTEGSELQIEGDGKPENRTVIAVSYTHLDVYKRQPLDWTRDFALLRKGS